MTRSLVLGAAATVAGIALHVLAVAMRDFGPTWGDFSLRGNGAIVVLPVAILALLVGEALCVCHRAWAGMALVPAGLFAGLFLILGTF